MQNNPENNDPSTTPPKYPWGDNCSIPPEKRFQPGQSGNPNGRKPKGRTIADLLDKIGHGKIKDFFILPERIRKLLLKLGDEVTVEEARQSLIYVYALKGESWANIHINERTEGRVASVVKLNFNPEDVQAQLSGLLSEEPQPYREGSDDQAPAAGGVDGDAQHPGQ